MNNTTVCYDMLLWVDVQNIIVLLFGTPGVYSRRLSHNIGTGNVHRAGYECGSVVGSMSYIRTKLPVFKLLPHLSQTSLVGRVLPTFNRPAWNASF